jgi:putative ABC transport system permease protein
MIAGGVSCLALLAFTLALVGVFGVMSYSVRQRTHEVGIRAALGADRKEILQMVVGRGTLITAMGIFLGLMGSFPVTRLLSSFLFRVHTFDPAVFMGVSLILAGAAVLACIIPARWATRVDPATSLRYE